MFGKNPIRPRSRDPRALHVESIFTTIQGEGPFAGQCATFIRLAGCNLACTFCDTQFETGMQKPTWNVAEICRCFGSGAPHFQKLVVITGGEPLRQNLNDLLAALWILGVQKVQLETAGVLWDEALDVYVGSGFLEIVCSPKTKRVHPRLAELCRHWKYVISHGDQNPVDGLPRASTQKAEDDGDCHIWRREGGWLHDDVIWASPKDEYDPRRNTMNLHAVRNLAMQQGYRVSLQMHKILGVE